MKYLLFIALMSVFIGNQLHRLIYEFNYLNLFISPIGIGCEIWLIKIFIDKSK